MTWSVIVAVSAASYLLYTLWRAIRETPTPATTLTTNVTTFPRKRYADEADEDW